jgi:hypothetical protein
MRRKDGWQTAAERIVFDDDGPFRKALMDVGNDQGLADALAEELRVLIKEEP